MTAFIKMGQVIAAALYGSCLHISAQTTNNAATSAPVTSPEKAMNFKMTNEQCYKVIANPTDADIRGMIASLTNDFGPVLSLETPGNAQYLSMDEITKGKFGFTCKDGNIAWTTKDGFECSPEVAIKIIISYRDQTPDWKKLGEWEQSPL